MMRQMVSKTVKYLPFSLFISLSVTFGSIVVTLCAAMDFGYQQWRVESVCKTN